MQKTTAQSQQESQKTRARLVLFWKPLYNKEHERAFNVARPRQRNIYQIMSSTTCNLHAYRQASELRTAFFISTTLLSFEQLIHLDYLIWRRVGWWRNSMVARWPDTVARNRDNKAHTHTHTHTIHIYLPFTRKSDNRKDENRKMWKLKDVKIVAAEISLINSVPVRIKFSRVLTLSKTRPSSDVWTDCENAKS